MEKAGQPFAQIFVVMSIEAPKLLPTRGSMATPVMSWSTRRNKTSFP